MLYICEKLSKTNQPTKHKGVSQNMCGPTHLNITGRQKKTKMTSLCQPTYETIIEAQSTDFIVFKFIPKQVITPKFLLHIIYGTPSTVDNKKVHELWFTDKGTCMYARMQAQKHTHKKRAMIKVIKNTSIVIMTSML